MLDIHKPKRAAAADGVRICANAGEVTADDWWLERFVLNCSYRTVVDMSWTCRGLSMTGG